MSARRLLAGALAAMVPGLGMPAAPPQEPNAFCNHSVTGIAFGIYDPASPVPTTANGQVVMSCTHNPNGTENITVTISITAGNSGVHANRYMTNGTQNLFYNVFTSTSYATIFGEAAGQTVTDTFQVKKNNPAVTRTYPVAGRIPAAQDVLPGIYSDTLQVIILY